MGVSYKKLFKLLIDRGMKKKDLQEAADLIQACDEYSMYYEKLGKTLTCKSYVF